MLLKLKARLILSALYDTPLISVIVVKLKVYLRDESTRDPFIKLFSCSVQLSMKFILLINVKMFISMKND